MNRSVPLKNGTVEFAVGKSSERSFTYIAISSAKKYTRDAKYQWLLVGWTKRLAS